MKFRNLYCRVWDPVKKWINKVVNRNDDNDNHFNHPYAIF